MHAWLNTLNAIEPTPQSIVERVGRLTAAGFQAMDGYHLAWAEYLRADVLVTTDDEFLSQSTRAADIIRIRVLDPVTLAGELAA